jgi:hypothetical protein
MMPRPSIGPRRSSMSRRLVPLPSTPGRNTGNRCECGQGQRLQSSNDQRQFRQDLPGSWSRSRYAKEVDDIICLPALLLALYDKVGSLDNVIPVTVSERSGRDSHDGSRSFSSLENGMQACRQPDWALYSGSWV